MATVAPPKTVPSIKDRKKATTGGHAASEALIAERIQEAQTALWRAELSRTLLIPVVTSLIAITLWAAMDQWVYSPGKFVRSIALLGAVAGLVYWIARRVWPLLSQSVRPEYAAQSLEHDLPELRHSLTSYVSLHDDHDREGVRGVVVRSIGVRAASQLQSHDVEVPSEASGNLPWWLAVAAALALAAAYAVFSPKDTFQSTKRLLMPLASIAPPSRVEITDVLPGEVTVLAGRPFEVSAKINGLRKGEEAFVEYGPNFVNARPLEVHSETGRLASAIVVDASGEYRIVAGDTVAGPYAVTTRDVPTVVIDRIDISPPAYTRLPERSTSGGAIVGEENSIAKIVATTNRPIDRARVEFNPRTIGDKVQASGGVLDMTISGDGSQIEASFPLKLAPNRSVVTIESYRLRVWDSADNENLEPIVYPVRIIADLVPEISIAEPQAILTEVPINSAQRIEVLALDPDYGLKQIDLQIKRGVDVVKNETLWSSVEGERGNQIRVWMFEPKALGLRVGETVDVFAIASDNRHDSNGTPAANVVTTDSIALRIVEPVDESQLPRFDRPEDQADGQAKQQPGEDGQQGESSEKNQSGQGGQGGQGEGQQGKGQQGDGQQGEGQQGDGQQGEGQEGEGQEGEGQEGKGQQGKGQQGQDQRGEGQQGKGQQGEGQSGEGQQAESGTDPNGGGMPKDGAPQGDPSDPESAPEGNERQGNERQVDGGAGNNSEQQPDGSGQKPQHDGDAFERIRDYINEAKNQQQQGDGKSQQDGEQQRPQSSPDAKPGSSDGAAGNQQGNEPQAGEKQAGDKNAGDKNAGDKQSSDHAPSDKPSGEGAGEDAARDEPNGAASSETATPPSKPSGKPDQTQSEPGTDGTQDGSSKPGEMNSKDGQQDSTKPRADGQETPGDSSTPSQGDGDQGKQNQQGKQDPQKGQGATKGNGDPSQAAGNKESTGEDAASEGDAKEGAANEDGSSEDSPSEGKGDNGKGGKKADSDAKQNQSKAAPPDDQQGTPGEAPDGKPNPNGDSSAKPSDSSSSSGGFGGDYGINTDPQDTARPPDPVDVESARQATDMVLDYLDSQRETPDPELLERLDWTPDELRAFADRWNRLRGTENGAAGDQKQIEEALRSLGIRSNQTGPIGKATERDDTMRGLKDTGNRTPAPAIHRDAFDAFRRNANRQ